jgi:hypothetical protein
LTLTIGFRFADTDLQGSHKLLQMQEASLNAAIKEAVPGLLPFARTFEPSRGRGSRRTSLTLTIGFRDVTAPSCSPDTQQIFRFADTDLQGSHKLLQMQEASLNAAIKEGPCACR